MTSRSNRRVRKPPRTARHNGRRITRRHHPKTASAGERKQQRECHHGLAGPVPPVVGGAAWCLRTRLDFNEDSPKRNAEPRRATMVVQAYLMRQATVRDVLMLTPGLSRWKLSRTAGGGDHAVMCRVENGRDFRLQRWQGLRVVPSKIGAFATTEMLASAPERCVVEPSHARLQFASGPSRAWARLYSDPSTLGVDLQRPRAMLGLFPRTGSPCASSCFRCCCPPSPPRH